MDKTKQLFSQRATTIFLSATALYTYFYKLLLSYYQTIILGTEKDYWIIYKQKKYFWVVTTRVFPQRFYYLMKPFFLKSVEQLDTDSLFATIPLYYSLFGVACTKGVECLCTQSVKCNTGVILSESEVKIAFIIAQKEIM